MTPVEPMMRTVWVPMDDHGYDGIYICPDAEDVYRAYNTEGEALAAAKKHGSGHADVQEIVLPEPS